MIVYNYPYVCLKKIALFSIENVLHLLIMLSQLVVWHIKISTWTAFNTLQSGVLELCVYRGLVISKFEI